MSDVLIAWVADGDGDSGVHLGLRDTAWGSLAGDGARERITLLRREDSKGRIYALRREVVLWQSPKDCWGLARFPRKYLHVPAPDRSVLPTLHCFVG